MRTRSHSRSRTPKALLVGAVTLAALAAAVALADTARTAPPADGLAPPPHYSAKDLARLKAKGPQTRAEREYAYMSTYGAIARGLLARPTVAPPEAGQQVAVTASSLVSLTAPIIGSSDIIVHGLAGDVSLQSETSIAANADGSILIAGYNDQRGFAVAPLSVSGVARSSDGGLTWDEVFSPPSLLPSVAGGSVFGDPDVKYDALNDRFIYASIYVRPSDGLQGMCIHVSNSGATAGTSWTGPTEVTPAFIAGAAADKEFIDVNPVTGRIILTWSNFGATIDILTTFSDNGGTTWSSAVDIGAGPGGGAAQGSMPRFDPGTMNSDSKAYVVWRVIDGSGIDTIHFNRSTDGGATWGSDTTISTAFAFEDEIPGNDRKHTFPAMAVDWTGGNIYIVYQRNNATGEGDVGYLLSTDGGTSFAPTKLIDSNPGADRAQFYPTIAVDQSNGNVHVSYLDEDYGSSGDILEVMHQVSTDSGATFGPPTPLNDRPFHAGFGNDTSQPNMGDYNQITAVDGVLHSVWGGTSVAPRYDEGQPTSASMNTPDTYYDQRADADTVVPLRLTKVNLSELGCFSGANGVLDPGETVSLFLPLENYVGNANAGATTITNISATLSTATAGVTVTTPNATYKAIPALLKVNNDTPFVVSVSNAFVAGTYIDFLLTVSSDQGDTELPLRMATGSAGATTSLISEDFNGVVAPALPAGWTASHGGGTTIVPWITGTTLTASNAAFHANSGTTGLKFERLFSPIVVVPTPGGGAQSYLTLDFDITYNLEDEPTQSILGYDGVTLRVTDQTAGNTLRSNLVEAFAEDITTDGTFKHFPKHLPRLNSSSYFQDMSVWSGDSGGAKHVSMKFPGEGMVGRSIQLRFEYTEDSFGDCTLAGHSAPCGVAIDNIVLKHVVSADDSCNDSDLIFKDSVESGDFSAWSSTMTDGGDLAVSGAAAMAGAFGIAATVNDTNAIGVRDDSPNNENRYRARFYFDPNGFTVGTDGDRTKIMQIFEDAPTRRLATIVLRQLAGQYYILAKAHLDDNSFANSGFFPISDGPHTIEIDWVRSSAPATPDGSFQLWIDGTSMSNLTGLVMNLSSVDYVRLGVISVKAGATGTLFFDSFESRRLNFIGP